MVMIRVALGEAELAAEKAGADKLHDLNERLKARVQEMEETANITLQRLRNIIEEE